MTFTVLVAGGGVGGLALAQGLRQAGVGVRVFEKDGTADSRGQGYRLRIDEHGIAALRQCLPADLYELFEATANPPYPPRGAVFDHHLNQIESWRGEATGSRPSTVANRRTLRQILLAGLGARVEFGRDVVGVSQDAGSATLHFSDGTSATGDVVVAADGVNSVIRRQLLPHAEVIDTGVRGLYGHAVLDDRLRAILPEVLFGGSSPVLGPRGVTMAVGVYTPRRPPREAAAAIAPHARLSEVSDYAKWTLVGPPEVFGFDDTSLWTVDPISLYASAARVTADWHPALVEMVRSSDGADTFPLSIRAAAPVPAWAPSRVTYLGDAIHATTPVGGTGANTALRDAAHLTRHLIGAARGRGRVTVTIGGYESRMREYGFEAARRSLRGAERIFQIPVAA